MNIWFQHVVNYHCFPHLARIALKVIVSKSIVNRNTLNVTSSDFVSCRIHTRQSSGNFTFNQLSYLSLGKIKVNGIKVTLS